MKKYLGDSVWVQEEAEAIVLTTENTDSDGQTIITNAIYLEPETLKAFQKYLVSR